MKIISLTAAILLFLALLNLPIGYYRFMRIGVTVAAIYLISQELKRGINIWVILMGLISILFNPIMPIYLGSKSAWKPIDIIIGLLFLIYTFNNKENDNK